MRHSFFPYLYGISTAHPINFQASAPRWELMRVRSIRRSPFTFLGPSHTSDRKTAHRIHPHHTRAPVVIHKLGCTVHSNTAFITSNKYLLVCSVSKTTANANRLSRRSTTEAFQAQNLCFSQSASWNRREYTNPESETCDLFVTGLVWTGREVLAR